MPPQYPSTNHPLGSIMADALSGWGFILMMMRDLMVCGCARFVILLVNQVWPISTPYFQVSAPHTDR